METNLSIKDLEQGDLCRFLFCKQSGNYRWYRWTCQAVYLGTKVHPDREIDVSFRPLAGTSSICIDNIISIERLVKFRDRKQHREDDQVMLPKRKSGAMTQPHTQGPQWVGDMQAAAAAQLDQAMAALNEILEAVPEKHHAQAIKVKEAMAELEQTMKEAK